MILTVFSNQNDSMIDCMMLELCQERWQWRRPKVYWGLTETVSSLPHIQGGDQKALQGIQASHCRSIYEERLHPSPQNFASARSMGMLSCVISSPSLLWFFSRLLPYLQIYPVCVCIPPQVMSAPLIPGSFHPVFPSSSPSEVEPLKQVDLSCLHSQERHSPKSL